MALQGTIDTFELTEVVRLLAAGAKTGVLRLEGTRGTGRVGVKDGKVTTIEVDHAPRADGHAEAMFELLRFDDGSFTFASGEEAETEGEPTDLEEILVDAEAKLAEWRDIERVVPTTRATVTLRGELSRADVVLDKARWRLVAAIGGGVTVATLGEAMDLGELPVSRAVKDLIELGVVDLDATPAEEPEVEASVAEAPPVDEPVAMSPVAEEPVIELDPSAVDPVAFEDPAAGTAQTLDEAEPVAAAEADGFDTARAQLDEFAAGFGLGDTPVHETTSTESPAFEMPPLGADDGFTDFGAEPADDPAANGSTGFDFSLGMEPEGSDPFGPDAGLPDLEPVAEGSPFLGAGNDAAEVARQLSNLSPAAARAVAAAAKATTDEEREAALEAVAQEGDEPIDRELLLRFLASVKS